MSSLLPVFEEFLKNAPQDASYDSVRQSVVILMGSLAKHLDKSDPKVKPIMAKLITALSTPSQQVYFCLHPSQIIYVALFTIHMVSKDLDVFMPYSDIWLCLTDTVKMTGLKILTRISLCLVPLRFRSRWRVVSLLWFLL